MHSSRARSSSRRLATLDRFTDGRLVVGVGQGWMEQEFEAAGVSMKRRGAGFEEHILAMRAVWGPDPVSFEGRSTAFPRLTSARNRCGRAALDWCRAPAQRPQLNALDGSVGLTLVIFDWDTIRETIETFRTAAGAAGHDPDTLPIMLQVNGNVTTEPLDERGPLLGSTDQVAADLDQAAKLGIEHVYWNSDDDPLSQLPLLGQLRRG
jgi:alkanesulfonate monooxygenase SsuD/methylene tetrahydromethanopterin reductase-like flavin-dependent oxidoreductase (luciferase family)